MNEYAVGRASADLRDAILKCLGIGAPIRLPGPTRRQRPKAPRPAPKPRTTYIVSRCKRVETISATVAEFYELTPEQLAGPRGSAFVSNARQVAMYLSRELANQSFPRIGWMFGRDHTTVMHACEVVAERIAGDPEYADDIREISDTLSDLSPLFTTPQVGDATPSDAYASRWNEARTELAA
jgi:hypothetical protein